MSETFKIESIDISHGKEVQLESPGGLASRLHLLTRSDKERAKIFQIKQVSLGRKINILTEVRYKTGLALCMRVKSQ
jgi:hypothetical protein